MAPRSSTSGRTRTARSRSRRSPRRSTSGRRSSVARRSRIARVTGRRSAGIGRIAHERGALVLADSYQAVGAIELDVRALDVDFVTGGTVKYLLASAGLGFLYVRASSADGLLPTQTRLVRGRGHLPDGHLGLLARRATRGGSTPARPVPNIYAGLAGMSIVEEVGVPAIEAHVRGLDDPADRRPRRAAARRSSRHATRPDAAPLVCFRSTDPAGSSPSSRPSGSSSRCATTASASHRTSTTSTTTSTAWSRRLRVRPHLLA